jgi:hypothetical protein
MEYPPKEHSDCCCLEFILAGIANEVKAADLSDSKCHEQPEREIRTQ